MSNNQVQEPLITGWEMIPHPSFYHDATKMKESTGFEKSEHTTANQELLIPIGGFEMVVQQPSCSQEAATEGIAGQSITPIKVDPISSFNPEQGNRSSTKGRKGTRSVRLELLKWDFTLGDLFKLNNIEELNQGTDCGERNLDPEKVLKNMKGWKIEKRRRNDIIGHIDKFYHHPDSKRKLRSRVEVKNFVKEKSYLNNAFDNGDVEGNSQHPNVNIASSSGEVSQEFPWNNPRSKFVIDVYECMIERFRQEGKLSYKRMMM